MVRIMMVFRVITVLAIIGLFVDLEGQSNQGIAVFVLCSSTKFHIIYVIFIIVSSLLI